MHPRLIEICIVFTSIVNPWDLHLIPVYLSDILMELFDEDCNGWIMVLKRLHGISFIIREKFHMIFTKLDNFDDHVCLLDRFMIISFIIMGWSQADCANTSLEHIMTDDRWSMPSVQLIISTGSFSVFPDALPQKSI